MRGGSDGRDIRAGRSAVRENRGSYMPFVRRLFAVYSSPPPAIPLGGGLVRKWIVM